MRAAAAAAALLAAATLPGERPGIAVPLVAALVLATCLPAVRRSTASAASAVLALALAMQAALLDAGWIVGLDLAAAVVLATFAAGGPHLVSLVTPLARLADVAPLLPRPAEVSRPYLRGAGLASVVVLPFAVLFLTGDAAFAALADGVPLPDVPGLPGRTLTFGLVLAGALGLGLAARRPPVWRELTASRPFSFAEWLIPLAVLDALFVAFVVVQVAVLFGGHDRVLRTSGLTYAEYARSGFWQLLAAAALTFVVVRGSVLLASTRDRRERLLLRALLATLCLLSLVVLASALHRLHLYEDAYGLTRARLFAEAVILWLGALLVLTVGATSARRRYGWVAVLGTSLALLAFSLSNPDRRVAERNVARWQETGRLDDEYLAGLSADAVPPLLALPPSVREYSTARMRYRFAGRDPWSSWNRSRAEARRLLAHPRRAREGID